ncbi:hypothetical protein P7K49_018737, partial [Saguinus oedipus]
ERSPQSPPPCWGGAFPTAPAPQASREEHPSRGPAVSPRRLRTRARPLCAPCFPLPAPSRASWRQTSLRSRPESAFR